MENTKSRREPNTKLGSDVNNVEKKIINLSGSLFLVSAAILPKTNPKIIAVTTAISPSFAEILKDVFIPAGKSLTAEDGDKVLAEIKDHGNKRRSPEGKIIEILGKPGECGVDVLCVAKSYELPMEFPEKVAKQAERIKETLNEGDFYGREDLRDVVMVTIDGEDAKDLDDAVSLTKEEDLYHLGVHIADVSNYVQYNSALDKEALKRGTSVYLADRVIPMLPQKLSNGICSLNAGEDRLALSCLMDIDKKGRVVSHRIVESVIHVKERMSYTNVKKILLQEDEELEKRYEELLPMFFQMKELSELLRNRRKKRGAIDFDFPESKLVLDEKMCIRDRQGSSHKCSAALAAFTSLVQPQNPVETVRLTLQVRGQS